LECTRLSRKNKFLLLPPGPLKPLLKKVLYPERKSGGLERGHRPLLKGRG